MPELLIDKINIRHDNILPDDMRKDTEGITKEIDISYITLKKCWSS